MVEPEVCDTLSSKTKDQNFNLSERLGEEVESAEKMVEGKKEEDDKPRKEEQLSVEESPAKMEVDPTDSPPEEQGTALEEGGCRTHRYTVFHVHAKKAKH